MSFVMSSITMTLVPQRHAITLSERVHPSSRACLPVGCPTNRTSPYRSVSTLPLEPASRLPDQQNIILSTLVHPSTSRTSVRSTHARACMCACVPLQKGGGRGYTGVSLSVPLHKEVGSPASRGIPVGERDYPRVDGGAYAPPPVLLSLRLVLQ